MFNSRAKQEAIARLHKEAKIYKTGQKDVRQKAVDLFQLRHHSSKTTIAKCEKYISKLANAPRDFQKSISNLKIKYKSYNTIANAFNEESKRITTQGSVGAAAGVASGVGIAALGPSAALAIATTFGTASTGTAISALSGAAATNAALAWLGGGALATGGGGIAMGNAILALAGPIGWTIGGIALTASAVFLWKHNKKLAEQANTETRKIHKEVLRLKRYLASLTELLDRTEQHADGVKRQLHLLESRAPSDYTEFTPEQKHRLASLVNNVNSLSELLNMRISL